MPGAEPKDVKITVEDGILQISWEHEEQKDEQNKDYLRRERRSGDQACDYELHELLLPRPAPAPSLTLGSA